MTLKSILIMILKGVLIISALTAIVFGFYTISWGYEAFLLEQNRNLRHFADLGQYYSGSTVMLFTFATVLFVILAFLNQLEEIKKQAKIIEQQDKIIEQQQFTNELNRVAAIKNSRNIHISRFENTFFKLLEVYHSTIKRVMFLDEWEPTIGFGKDFKGKEAFQIIYFRLERLVNQSAKNVEDRKEVLKQAYENFYLSFEEMLGDYFKAVEQMYRLMAIKRADGTLTQDDLEYYMVILHTEFNEHEYYLQYYHGLCYDDSFIKGLAEDLCLFDKLNKSKLLKDDDYRFYKDTAFYRFA